MLRRFGPSPSSGYRPLLLFAERRGSCECRDFAAGDSNVSRLLALIPYRLCHHFLCQFRPRVLGKLLAVPAFAAQRMAVLLFGIEIDSRAHIGGGLFINHFGGIIVGPVNIGANCNISQGVTLGRSSRVTGSSVGDVPTLGDRVWLRTRELLWLDRSQSGMTLLWLPTALLRAMFRLAASQWECRPK